MSNFVTFRHKSNGQVRDYPEHYENHPTLGADLERYTLGDSEYEEDKVVVEGHELPVDQRGIIIAKELEELTKPELSALAEKRGLPVTGTKTDLIDRISEDKENN